MRFFSLISFVILSTLSVAHADLEEPTPGQKSGHSLKDLMQVRKAQIRNLEARHKIEIKELKADQEVRRKEWEKSESDHRHDFFKDHPKGSERRAYIQDFLKRREELKKQMTQELVDKQRLQDTELNDLRGKHAQTPLSEGNKVLPLNQE